MDVNILIQLQQLYIKCCNKLCRYQSGSCDIVIYRCENCQNDIYVKYILINQFFCCQCMFFYDYQQIECDKKYCWCPYNHQVFVYGKKIIVTSISY